jgi:hypothetical protein
MCEAPRDHASGSRHKQSHKRGMRIGSLLQRGFVPGRIMRSSSRRVANMAAFIAACACVTSTSAADDGAAASTMLPYTSAASIRVNLNAHVPAVAGSGGGTRAGRFSEILDKISSASVAAGEAADDDFGKPFDEIYAGMDAGRIRAAFSIESSVSAGIGEVAGAWWSGDERLRGFDVLAGVRYFDTAFAFKFLRVNATVSGSINVFENLNDFMIGARYTADLSDHWTMTLRGDEGLGSTDSNYNASVGANYHSGNVTWSFTYRYMDTRFNQGGRTVDLLLVGPAIGYTLAF